MKDKNKEKNNSFNETNNVELLEAYDQGDVETNCGLVEVDEVLDSNIEGTIENFEVETDIKEEKKKKPKVKKVKSKKIKPNFLNIKTLFSKKDKSEIKSQLKQKHNVKESYSNAMDKVVESKVFNMKSLGAKLIFSITICTAILVAIIIFVLSSFMGGLVKKTYTAECEISMKAIEQQLDNYRVDSVKYADSLASDSSFVAAVVNNDKIDIAKKMQEYLLSSRGDYVFVTDEKGKIIASPGSKFNGSNVCENPAIAGAIKGQTVTTINDTKNMPFSIISASPIITATGKLKGSVLIGYSLYDTNLVDNLKELTGNDFTICKDNVRINTTFKSNGEREINTKIDEKIAKKVIKKGQSYQREMDLFSKKRLVIYKPLKDNDEKVVGMVFTSKDISSIIKSKKATSYLAIVLSIGIFVLVAIVIISLIKRLINKPLKKLVVLANKIEDGDIGIGKDEEEVIVKYSKDEIGELSKALDSTTRSLKKYMGEITYVLGELAKGNLKVESNVEFKGDFVGIKEDLDNIVVSLKDTITSINGASIQVSSGAQQVAGGSQALSQGSAEQASAIEELSASINEISDKIKANALNANKATSYGEQAAEGVINSNNQMQAMVAAMDDINKTANEISKIIKTIDDIAFQTNILALNASVEAARAGSAGRGFAVVANEVRSLAEKSAEAANQTTALIENSIKAVKKGNKIAQQTADSLDLVVDKSKFVMNLVDQISVESNNQAQGVNDISMGVDQISAVVQTNAATAEESAAASEELSSQSAMLQELISKFKID